MTITHYSSLETLAATEFRTSSWWASIARALDDPEERPAQGATIDNGATGAIVDAVNRQPSLSNQAVRLRDDQARMPEILRQLHRLVAELAGDDGEATHVAEEWAVLALADERHQQRSWALYWESFTRDIGGE